MSVNQNETPKKSGFFKQIKTSLGILDSSVVKACDANVQGFAVIVLVGLLGSAILRWVIFSETLEFLQFEAKYIHATLIGVTMIGVTVDHAFFRSSLERLASQRALTTAKGIKAILPMYRDSFFYPFLLRLALLSASVVLVLVILLKASQGPIAEQIKSRELNLNAKLMQSIDQELDREKAALELDLANAREVLSAAEVAWEKENAIFRRKLDELYADRTFRLSQAQKLSRSIADLRAEKEKLEHVMYCEAEHSRTNAIPKCADVSSGKPGKGKLYRDAKRQVDILAGKILDTEEAVYKTADALKEIMNQIDRIKTSSLDTQAERQLVTISQDRLTNFERNRSQEHQSRFLSSRERVELDPKSLALQISVLSDIWSAPNVGLPLLAFAMMFAVLDLAFALVGVFFAPREYVTRLATKMVQFETDYDQKVHQQAIARVGHVVSALEAKLDVDVQSQVGTQSFARSEAKKRRIQAADKFQLDSALRKKFFEARAASFSDHSPHKH